MEGVSLVLQIPECAATQLETHYLYKIPPPAVSPYLPTLRCMDN